MCQRMLMMAAAGVALCSYRGKQYEQVSIDSRCAMSRDFNDVIGTNILSFANSDKPGVMLNIANGERISTFEFTDSVPDGALIIEYVDPETATGEDEQLADQAA